MGEFGPLFMVMPLPVFKRECPDYADDLQTEGELWLTLNTGEHVHVTLDGNVVTVQEHVPPPSTRWVGPSPFGYALAIVGALWWAAALAYHATRWWQTPDAQVTGDFAVVVSIGLLAVGVGVCNRLAAKI